MLRIFSIALCLCGALSAGDLQKANEYLQQALQATDNQARITLLRQSLEEQVSFAGHLWLGKALREDGQLAAAMREFRKALELTTTPEEEDRSHALFQIGSTMEQQKSEAEALVYMRRSLALEKEPSHRTVVAKQIGRLEMQLASAVIPAAQLEGAFRAARDLALDGGPGRIDIWVQFKFDSADFTATGSAQAKELGKAMSSEDFKTYRFRVIGHTDLFGSTDYNLALSRRRADNVAVYLKSTFKVPLDRISAEGRGMEEPLIKEGSKEEQSVNRRVEVVLLPPR